MTGDLVANHFASHMTSNALVTTKLKGNLIEMSVKIH